MNNCSVSHETEREYWGRVVREVQRLSGLTLEQLGDKFGVSDRDISYWKAGERRPTGMVAVRFFEYRRELLFHAGKLDTTGFIIFGTIVHGTGTIAG